MSTIVILTAVSYNWFGILAPLAILSVCLYKFGYSVKALLSFIGILIMFFVISDFASHLIP